MQDEKKFMRYVPLESVCLMATSLLTMLLWRAIFLL